MEVVRKSGGRRSEFPRMRCRRGGLGKNERHSVLKNRDEESLGEPILTSGRSAHLLAFVFSVKIFFLWRQWEIDFWNSNFLGQNSWPLQQHFSALLTFGLDDSLLWGPVLCIPGLYPLVASSFLLFSPSVTIKICPLTATKCPLGSKLPWLRTTDPK